MSGKSINFLLGLLIALLFFAYAGVKAEEPYKSYAVWCGIITGILLIICSFKTDRKRNKNKTCETTDDTPEPLDRFENLKNRYGELNALLMIKSAQLSESEEALSRLRNEVKIHRDQRDHNKCWMNDFRLHQSLNDNKIGSLPNPQKITLPEMLWGCKVYCPGLYPKLTAKDEQMITEIGEVIKKYMY